MPKTNSTAIITAAFLAASIAIAPIPSIAETNEASFLVLPGEICMVSNGTPFILQVKKQVGTGNIAMRLGSSENWSNASAAAHQIISEDYLYVFRGRSDFAFTRLDLDGQVETGGCSSIAPIYSELQSRAEAEVTSSMEERLSQLLADQEFLEEEISRVRQEKSALRERVETELITMTLALEEKRKEAEETLTLLAASRAAEEGLNEKLSAALLANAELDLKLQDTQSDLLQAFLDLDELTASRDDLEARLASALAANLAAQQGTETKADLEEQLARALEAKLAAESAAQDQQAKLSEVEKTLAELRTRLADALLEQQKNEEAAAERMSDADKADALLATAREELSKAKSKNEDAQRDMELLNQQVADLRVQMGKLQTLIDEAEAKDVASQVQITSLGNRLNAALTRAAAEERRRRQAEEEINALLQAEKDRLEQENEVLEKYRSDFFGRLRDLVGEHEGVQIVGDRFVFSSEVLFPSGKADLSDSGKNEIANIASLLLDIQDEIPPELDWVIRVDGHTDNIRVLPGGEFADNWELSQARALSVVRGLVGLGLRPDRLSANGFGHYQPINPANTAEARAQNRRIELKLTER